MEPQRPTVSAPVQPQPKRSRNPNLKGKMIMLLMMVIFLLIGAVAGYMYRDSQAKKDLDTQKAKVSALELKNTQLTGSLAAASKPSSTTTTTVETSVRPSQATLDSIAAAITSGNTAALEGYMASSVNVIRAATGAPTNGARTPAQAVTDVAYVNAGTAPWNFALPASTLATYQSGDYKQYFPTTAYVGKSANNYVISFQFDSHGKINGIFMSVDASLL